MARRNRMSSPYAGQESNRIMGVDPWLLLVAAGVVGGLVVYNMRSKAKYGGGGRTSLGTGVGAGLGI